MPVRCRSDISATCRIAFTVASFTLSNQHWKYCFASAYVLHLNIALNSSRNRLATLTCEFASWIALENTVLFKHSILFVVLESTATVFEFLMLPHFCAVNLIDPFIEVPDQMKAIMDQTGFGE